MFNVQIFKDVRQATEYVKKILAELESQETLDFQIIHSISEMECIEEGGQWEDVSSVLLAYMRDLDSQNGYMIYDQEDDCWDYMDWDSDDKEEDNIYKPKDLDEIFVEAGDGLVVLHNSFAVCEHQFPIVIVKRSFYETQTKRVTEMLKYVEPGNDYTTKISPAIYVEIFYNKA